jgi:plastocyanin
MRIAAALVVTLCISACNHADRLDSSNQDSSVVYELAEPEKAKGGSEPVTHVIEIIQMKFVPDVVNISLGDSVVWINKDIVQHDVTELNSNAWSSSKLESGARWKTVITKSQLYHCSLHVVMNGKIIVDGNDIAMKASGTDITSCYSKDWADSKQIVANF